jgi:hypothetical protein
LLLPDPTGELPVLLEECVALGRQLGWLLGWVGGHCLWDVDGLVLELAEVPPLAVALDVVEVAFLRNLEDSLRRH